MRVKDYNGRNTSITRGTLAWFLKDETQAQFGDLLAQRYLILIRSGKSSDICWTLALQHSSFCTPAYWIGRIVHDTEDVGEKKWNDINANEIPSSGLLEHLLKLPVKLLCLSTLREENYSELNSDAHDAWQWGGRDTTELYSKWEQGQDCPWGW